MRPGEIFGLRWERLQGRYAEIRQRVYRGKVDTPKTTNSIRMVALTEGLLTDIEEWRRESDRMSESLGISIGDSEHTPVEGQLLAAKDWAEAQGSWTGLGTFQVMRRTHSSLMRI